jgi:hypothetical protein
MILEAKKALSHVVLVISKNNANSVSDKQQET